MAFPKHGDSGDEVGYLQFQLENLGYDVGTVDNSYGDKTAVALAKFVKAYNGKVVDGKRVTSAIQVYLDVSMIRKFGPTTYQSIFDRLQKLEKAMEAMSAAPAPVPGAGGLTLPLGVRLIGTLEVDK